MRNYIKRIHLCFTSYFKNAHTTNTTGIQTDNPQFRIISVLLYNLTKEALTSTKNAIVQDNRKHIYMHRFKLKPVQMRLLSNCSVVLK